MPKYEYVTIESEKKLGAQFSKHREIISQYASKGYKYVGHIPTKMSDPGKIIEIDLIFENQQ